MNKGKQSNFGDAILKMVYGMARQTNPHCSRLKVITQLSICHRLTHRICSSYVNHYDLWNSLSIDFKKALELAVRIYEK